MERVTLEDLVGKSIPRLYDAVKSVVPITKKDAKTRASLTAFLLALEGTPAVLAKAAIGAIISECCTVLTLINNLHLSQTTV
jgi:hypothetical protein